MLLIAVEVPVMNILEFLGCYITILPLSHLTSLGEEIRLPLLHLTLSVLIAGLFSMTSSSSVHSEKLPKIKNVKIMNEHF